MTDLGAVFDLLTLQGFQDGLVAGMALLGGFFAFSNLAKSPVIGWAIGYALAVLLVLRLQSSVDWLVLGSFGAVAIAGLALDVAYNLQIGPAGYAARLTAWLLTATSVVAFTVVVNTTDEMWIAVGFPSIVLLAGAAVWSSTDHAEILGPLVAVTVLGAWVTVPETDVFAIVVGVSLPLVFATLPPVRARAAGVGSFAFTGIISWLIVTGGQARPVSIIGGWAAFGILLVIPWFRLLALNVERPLPVLAIHIIFVILATRVVDIWETVPVALSIITGLLIVSAIALAALGSTDAEEPHLESGEPRVT